MSWRNVAPFILGGAIGVPIGTVLLTYINPMYMRLGVGLLLIVFGSYGLLQPKLTTIRATMPTDGAVGAVNGVLCGLTGLPGFIITVWCQMRGWTKDQQRAVFQPVMLAAIIMTAASLTAAGAITAEIIWLYVLGLPALLAGLWLGFRLYGKLDEVAFRKVMLGLLLFSGLALTISQVWPWLPNCRLDALSFLSIVCAACPCVAVARIGPRARSERFGSTLPEKGSPYGY
jgi:uncharacterized membrane protein YfcA